MWVSSVTPLNKMHWSAAVFCVFFAYFNVLPQTAVLSDCSALPSNLPVPLKHLLSLGPPGASAPKCGCSEPCGCLGSVVAAPTPPFGCVSPALGLSNPVIGVQSCGCKNALGTCNCGNAVIGNLCGKSTPSVGIATTCGCSDPAVRIVDGCPNCQPVYSYNLPSLGVPTFGNVGLSTCGCGNIGLSTCGCGNVGLSTCGCGNIGLSTCGCGNIGLSTCGCGGIALPSFSSVGLPLVNIQAPCGCPVNACSCKGPCGRPLSSCTCNSPCGCNVNSCGCVEVPCGPPKVKTTCTCVTPTIETPCGRAQGTPQCACTTTLELPTCGVPVVPPFAPVIGCSRYLRQVVVQPPFL